MQYKEIVLKIDSKNVDTATAIISLLDIGGIYTEDYSDLEDCPLVKNFALVDEDLLKKDKSTALLHIYFSEDDDTKESLFFISERFSAENIEFEILENSVKEDDYRNKWKEFYKPIKIKDVVIVPEWENYEKEDGEVILKIDPGLAFGTGNHRTTSLCIEEIRNIDLKDKTVLDIGTGSGILSIAALLSGAKKVDAVDIDPVAVKVAKENAALNTFSGTFEAKTGNVLEKGSEIFNFLENKKYDIILANIVADVLILLSDFIKEYMAQNAYFLLSGIIFERKDEVCASLNKNGFKIENIKEKEGWVEITARN